MAKKQIAIILKPAAERQITSIAIYIEEKGYPLTAEKFAIRLYDFAESLGDFPEKYPLCRKKLLAKKGFRCAVFEENYVFIYKITREQVVIYHVAHTSRMK